jgi:hypothetical protein
MGDNMIENNHPNFEPFDRFATKEYVNLLLIQHEKDVIRINDLMQLRIDALDTAKTLAQQNLEVRLESMNNFRADLKNQAANFYTREIHDIYASAIAKEVESLKLSRAELAGKATQSGVFIAYIIGIIGLIISILSFIIHIMP